MDRTKGLHGPRTRANGETKYIKNHHKFWTEPRPCMVHGLKPMGKPSTKRKSQVLDRTKALHGPRTQAYGKTKYKKENLIGFGQNQGLAWYTGPNLWGNQPSKKKKKKKKKTTWHINLRIHPKVTPC